MEKAKGILPPTLATSPSPYTDKEISRHTNKLQKAADMLLVDSEIGVESDIKRASQFEKTLKYAADPRLIEFSKDVDLSFDNHREWKNINDELMVALGGDNDSIQDSWNAMQALRIVSPTDSSGDPKAIHKERIGTLAVDPYVREYGDSCHQATLDEDNEALDFSTNQLRGRLVEIGVPESDVDGILDEVNDRVHSNFMGSLWREIASSPAGELPEWEPYNVQEGIDKFREMLASQQRADEKRGYSRGSAKR